MYAASGLYYVRLILLLRVLIKDDILPRMQDKLENESPFTRPPPGPRKPLDETTRCKTIRNSLRSDMGLSHSDFQFLEEHPEQAKWLEDNIERRFWDKVRGDQRFKSPLLEN